MSRPSKGVFSDAGSALISSRTGSRPREGSSEALEAIVVVAIAGGVALCDYLECRYMYILPVRRETRRQEYISDATREWLMLSVQMLISGRLEVHVGPEARRVIDCVAAGSQSSAAESGPGPTIDKVKSNRELRP